MLKPVQTPGLLLHSEGCPLSPWLPMTKKVSMLLQAHLYATHQTLQIMNLSRALLPSLRLISA